MNGRSYHCPDLSSDHSESSSEEDFMEGSTYMDKMKTKVEKLKEEGNRYFGAAKYTLAIEKYEKALDVNKVLTEHGTRLGFYYKLKNNIAQCYLRRRMFEHALDAAVDAIEAGSDQCKSFIRASTAFVKLDKPESAFCTVKRGMFHCIDQKQKEDLFSTIQSLQDEYPRLSKIKEKNWSKVSIRELANEIKREKQQEPDTKRKKNTEEKKKQAKDAKAKEEEERKRKEEQERKAKEDEEKRRLKEQQRKDMEEKLVMSALPKSVSVQLKYNEYVQKGSQAMQNKVATTAFEFTGKALEIIKTDYANLECSKDLEETANASVVTLRYIHARAGVETRNYSNILVAKENYDLILTRYKAVRFPAVHLGLALLYKELNRYEEAKKCAESGIEFLMKGFSFTTMFWPGYPTVVILETLKEELLKLLQALLKELASPPSPDAICRYPQCLTHEDQTHFLPSENIFLSDPDYRGHYMLCCDDNCRLEYHKACWHLLKAEQDSQLNRLPTEKDFLSKSCLTPDCTGVIIRVEIHNQDGDVHKIEDTKRLEEEAKKRKEKMRRLEESKKDAFTAPGKKKPKKKKKTNSASPDSEADIGEIPTDPTIAKKDEFPVPTDASFQVDYSKLDLSQATILKKNAKEDQTDEVELAAKKKKNRRKGMSLLEFQATSKCGEKTDESGVNFGENEFDSRIQKANKFKNLVESRGFSNDPVVSPLPVNPTHSIPNVAAETRPTMSRKSEIPPASVGATVQQDLQVDRKVLFDYLHGLLSEFGPLHHEDSRIWVLLNEYQEVVNSFDGGLKEFIYMDPDNRFRVYKDYICLLDDLAKGIEMQHITDSVQTDDNPLQNAEGVAEKTDEPDIDDSDKKWLEIKQLLGMEPSPQDNEVKPLLDVSPKSNRCLESGTQTDISSVELDDGLDACSLAATNEQLALELQEIKDKNIRMQREAKLEVGELRESRANLGSENTRLKNEISRLREQNMRDRRMTQELLDKEKEHKEERDALVLELLGNKNELEAEQKLSFDLRNSLVEKDAEITTLKIFNVKMSATQQQNLISAKIDETKKCCKLLEEMRHNPHMNHHAAPINAAMIEMDQYSARLVQAQEEINQLLETKMQTVALEKVPKFEFDESKIMPPKLDINLLLMFLKSESGLSKQIEDVFSARLDNNAEDCFDRDVITAEPPGIPTAPLSSLPPQGAIGGPIPLVRAPTLNRAGFLDASTTQSDSASPPLSRPRAPPSPFDALHMLRSTSISNIRGLPPSSPRPILPLNAAQRFPAPTMPGGLMNRPQLPRFQKDMLPPQPPTASISLGPPPSPANSKGESSDAHEDVPRAVIQSIESGRRKTNEDKLVERICDKFPSIEKEKARNYVKQVRQNNGGKLTGMTVPIILTKVQELAALEESKDCSICLCELPDRPFVTTCGHQFHKECLDEWLQQETSGNACPNCREFLTNDDEFPQLR